MYEQELKSKLEDFYKVLGWDYPNENDAKASEFFGYQIAITWNAPEQTHYWESWIFYEYYTDKTKSKAERIEQCKTEFPNTWTRHSNGEEIEINYYDLILRKKYLK